MTTARPAPLARSDSASTPRSSFFADLPINRKLLLAGLALGAPLLITGGLAYQANQRQLQLASLQANAASHFPALEELQRHVRYVRGLSAKDIDRKVTDAMRSNAQALKRGVSSDTFSVSSQLATTLETQVTSLADEIDSGKISADEIFDRGTAIMLGDLALTFKTLRDEGSMVVVEDRAARQLAELSAETLPTLLPQYGRAYGGLIALADEVRAQPGGRLTDPQRAVVETAVTNGRAALSEMQAQVEALYDLSPASKEALADAYERAFADSDAAFDLIEENFLYSPRVTVTSAQLIPPSDKYLLSQYDAFKATADLMAGAYEQERQNAQRRLLFLITALAALVGLSLWLLSAVARSITSPLRRLTSASQQLSAGDLQAHVPVTSRDEFGVLSQSFNAATAQLRANAERDAQERLEAQKLQHNIGAFLDVTMDIADGDLTKRGQVTEDVLGNVVDSINLMTDELAGTLKQVQHASESVTGGSRQMLGTTHAIQQGAQLTAEQAQRVAEQVEQITRAIRTMAQSAQTSAETARQALLASQQGQQAVQETLGGMQNIRREVQGVSKKVKSLGDRSLEIQEIVDTISQIAEQTHLLAVNASIEAAGAGEAGGRFAIVADSVRKLASTSAQATTRIAALIKSVQLEVQDVIIGAEEGTREVEQGYRIAGSAGERLREIGQLTEHSAQLAESIAASTQQQVQGVEQVSQAVQQIASVAQQAEGAVEQGRSAAEQLEDLAQQLSAALRRFRLPA